MNIAKYLLIILTPIVIILVNFVYLMFNESFYHNLYSQSGVYEYFNNDQTVNYETKNLLGYFRGKNKLDDKFYSNQAIIHLGDVKKLIIESVNLLAITSLSAIFLTGLLLYNKRYTDLAKALLISSLAVIAAMILLAIGIEKLFSPLFIKFHELFFTNNLWMFSESDNLIKLFPQMFFVLFAKYLSTNILLTSALISVISLVYLRPTFLRSTIKK